MKQGLGQKGFSSFVVAIALAGLAIVVFGAYLVWQKGSDEPIRKAGSVKVPQNKNQEDNSDREGVEKTFDFLNGKITFVDDGTWKVATGGYWSAESGRCGRVTDSEQGCLDHSMLILEDEDFTNPDQFQVNISVFTDDRASGVSLEQWVDLEVGPGGTNPKRSYPTFDGYEAYRYEVAYDTHEVRLVYGIVVESKIVVIRSDFFRGAHNSYRSTNNYIPLILKVDKLVESISVE